MKSLNFKRILLGASALLQSVVLTGCALKPAEPSAPIETPPAPYCSTITSYSGTTITVNGTAYYAPRTDGNGEVEDGGYRYRPSATVSNGAVYSITLSGTTYSYTAGSTDDDQDVAQSLVSQINANSSAPVTAQLLRLRVSGSYQYFTLVNQKVYSAPWTVSHTKSANMTETLRAVASPIRHAEIMVRDGSGNIVQCGSTSSTGTYSLILPQSSGSYTIYVNSRVNSSVAKAYVLDYHMTNVHYSVSTSVSATASTSGNNVLASGEGAVLAGAFNIFDQIIKANEYLTEYVSGTYGCGTTYTDCTPYTAAPLVYAYWKKGVNPYTYYGVSSPSSFYTGNSRLYILGGVNGDVDNTDTDHFDNSVIVHEYGHFLEDIVAVSESPGGYHDGNSIVDPRLAWSEGFADFLQGAVSGQPYYRDTKGNSSGTVGGVVLINENLDTTTWDTPALGGEGLFREFSITRLLWDIIDPHPVSGLGGTDGGTDDVSNVNSMAELWTVFAGANGLKHSSNPFRHMGTVHKIQDAMAGRTAWSSLRTAEKQNGDAAYTSVGLREYATPLTNGVCASTEIDPVSDGGTFDSSNLRVNNDFLAFNHPGGTLTVQLKYTANVLSDPPDLDLYVYNSDYTYGSSSSMVGYSQNNRPSGCVATPANCTNVTETVSASAPAGYYLINIMAYTGDGGVGGAAGYTVTVNGAQKCLVP